MVYVTTTIIIKVIIINYLQLAKPSTGRHNHSFFASYLTSPHSKQSYYFTAIIKTIIITFIITAIITFIIVIVIIIIGMIVWW